MAEITGSRVLASLYGGSPSTTSWADQSGLNNNATLTNVVISDWKTIKDDVPVIVFPDNSTRTITFPSSFTYLDLSCSFLFCLTANPGSHRAIFTNSSIQVVQQNYALRVCFYGDTLATTPSLSPNQWYHAFVDNFSKKIYINGTDFTANLTLSWTNGAKPATVGVGWYNTFGGGIAKFKVLSGTAGYTKAEIVDESEAMLAYIKSYTRASLSEIQNKGDRINCSYRSSNSILGAFYKLGTTNSNLIASNGELAPDGSFYWVYVGEDHKKRKMFIADRNIQHTISWDELNKSGMTSTSGTDFILDYFLDSSSLLGSTTYSVLTNNYLTLTHAFNGGNYAGAKTLNPITSGKWYWEVYVNSYVSGSYLANAMRVGVINSSTSLDSLITVGNNSAIGVYTGTYKTGDTIGVAVDAILGTINFYKNGELIQTLTNYNFVSNTFYPAGACYQASNTSHDSMTFNFGTTDFRYSLPQGYLGLARQLGNNGYTTSVRLLKGGATTNLTESEWETYLYSTVVSTLLSGTAYSWNINTASWTTTNGSVTTNRIARGGYPGNPSVHVTSVTASTSYAFRPMLIVEYVTTSTNYTISQIIKLVSLYLSNKSSNLAYLQSFKTKPLTNTPFKSKRIGKVFR